MPDINTTSLPNGLKSVAYSQAITADKVVGIDVERVGSVPDGSSDPYGDLDTGVATEFTYAIHSDGEDDLAISAATISGETNCSVTVTTDPGGAIVEPGSSTLLIIAVTPTADGAFSFTINIISDAAGAEATYTINVSGTGTSYEFWSVVDGGGIGNRDAVENSAVSVEDGGSVS